MWHISMLVRISFQLLYRHTDRTYSWTKHKKSSFLDCAWRSFKGTDTCLVALFYNLTLTTLMHNVPQSHLYFRNGRKGKVASHVLQASREEAIKTQVSMILKNPSVFNIPTPNWALNSIQIGKRKEENITVGVNNVSGGSNVHVFQTHMIF